MEPGAQCWVQTPGAVASEIDGMLVVLAPDMSFFRLNGSAARIWADLAAPADREALVAGLREAFDVDPATAGAAVDRVLAEMAEHGIVSQA